MDLRLAAFFVEILVGSGFFALTRPKAKGEKERKKAIPSLLLSQEGTSFLAKPGNLRSIVKKYPTTG